MDYEVVAAVREELEPLGMDEEVPPIHVTKTRYDPRTWPTRVSNRMSLASYMPAFHRITLYEDGIEASADRTPEGRLWKDDSLLEKIAEARDEYEFPSGVEDTDVLNTLEAEYENIIKEKTLRVAAHEAVHGSVHGSLGPVKSRVYGFLSLTAPNVNEAAGQFFNLWFDEDLEDKSKRYEAFDHVEANYDWGVYDSGLINQYLAQGLNTYDDAEGTPAERAGDAMEFFKETYRENSGRAQFTIDRSFTPFYSGHTAFASGFTVGSAAQTVSAFLRGDELDIAFYGAFAAFFFTKTLGLFPTWPDDLDPDVDARDLLTHR